MRTLNYWLATFLVLSTITSCNPIQVGQSEFIERIENGLLPVIILDVDTAPAFNILERMKANNVPGVSIAYMDKGKIQWAKGYGITDTVRNIPVNDRTLFQAASISKPVAALGALALVEQGIVGLDENVNDYLVGWKVEENQFTAEQKVTLRRILSHSAGMTVHGFGGYSQTDEVPSIIQVLNGEEPANSERIFPDTVPGSIYRYSGGGYTVMQKMLCDITGKDFPSLMNDLVLSKTGMRFSTYEQPLPDKLDENAAWGHSVKGELVEGNWHTYPEMAAAGLWTTPSDLLRYASEVYKSYKGSSDKILSREMTSEMLTPQMDSHGLGPLVGGEGDFITFQHGGANEGFRCSLYVFTKSGQGVAVMANGDSGGTLNSEIIRSFSDALGWPYYKPRVKSVYAMDKEDLKIFSGKYILEWNDQDLVVKLAVEDYYLAGTQVWSELEFKLIPEAENRFFSLHDGVAFEFRRDEEGLVTQMLIYQGSEPYILEKVNSF